MNPKQLIIGIVYKRTCPEGKVYIGQTIDEKGRNKCWYNTKKYAGKRVNEARKKYLPDTWRYEVLYKLVSNDEKEALKILTKVENYYIKFFNSEDEGFGYNMEKGKMSCQNLEIVSKPVIIYDLYTLEKLYEFNSKISCNNFFNKSVIDKNISRISHKNKSLYSPPIGILPDNRFVLVYYKDKFSEEILKYDQQQSLKDTRYRRVIQLELHNYSPIKIWRNSAEAEKQYGSVISSSSIAHRCIKAEKESTITPFNNFIWLFLDHFDKLKQEGNLETLIKIKWSKRCKLTAVFSYKGEFIQIFDNSKLAIKSIDEIFKTENLTANYGGRVSINSFEKFISNKLDKVYVYKHHILCNINTLSNLIKNNISKIPLDISRYFSPVLRIKGEEEVLFPSIPDLIRSTSEIKFPANVYSAIKRNGTCMGYSIKLINNPICILDLESAKKSLEKFESRYTCLK